MLNLDEIGFADLYSQTIAYGLFTARCFDKEPQFTRQEAGYLVPKTNPFLRDTFDRIAGINLDERIVWAVDDLAELLKRTDIAAILQDFGKRTRQEDPVSPHVRDWFDAPLILPHSYLYSTGNFSS